MNPDEMKEFEPTIVAFLCNWCSYAKTGATDCIFRTQYMILDYYPVKELSLLERLGKLFGLS